MLFKDIHDFLDNLHNINRFYIVSFGGIERFDILFVDRGEDFLLARKKDIDGSLSMEELVFNKKSPRSFGFQRLLEDGRICTIPEETILIRRRIIVEKIQDFNEGIFAEMPIYIKNPIFSKDEDNTKEIL